MDIKTMYLEDLGLSNRSHNALFRSGVRTAEDLLQYDEESLYQIRSLGKKSIEEILTKIEELKDLQEGKIEDVVEDDPEDAALPSTAVELLQKPAFYDALQQFVRVNDIPVEQFPLTQAKISGLKKLGYDFLSDVILLHDSDLRFIPGMGEGTIQKFRSFIREYLNSHEAQLLAFCSGNTGSLLDDSVVREKLLGLYAQKGFGGFSLSEFSDALDLPESFGLDRLKSVIGGLLADGSLEYVDYRCYRNYDRFEDYLQQYSGSTERERDFIRRKLDGQTLEEIGTAYGLTRERVRQVIAREIDKIRLEHTRSTGQQFFDEEYYLYLYKNYSFDRDALSEPLGVTPSIWRFLDLVCEKRGKKDLKDSLEDPNLDPGLRYRIRNYLNRDKVFIDGNWVEKKLKPIEDVVVKKLCKEDTSWADFLTIFNRFLKDEGLDADDSLQYTKDILKSRKNRLSESRTLLWKQGEVFRYYDIDAQDYTELLDVLGLASFENVEYSTEKFMQDYPDILKKYDIRDRYELHNLLRKVVPEGSYHDFHSERTPNIRFGTFDRDAAIREIMFRNAPVTADELAQKIYEEYGFDPATVKGTYLGSLLQYYHQGRYTVDAKIMPKSNADKLRAALTEDFYYLTDVRKIYADLIPDSDPEDINAFNLKGMGFLVFSGYILQNHPSLDQYFTELLTGSVFVALRPLKNRFGYISMFSNRLMDLKRDLQLIEYEPDMAIHLRKLESSGVDKEQFYKFCDAVYDFVEDGSYFSIQSIKADGFDSELFELGFSDWFYSNLLLSDSRLSFTYIFRNLVFYKGYESITVKSFLADRVREYGKIDILDLMTELKNRYGCAPEDKWDITYKLADTGIYRDPIQDSLYANEDLYYQEMDEV